MADKEKNPVTVKKVLGNYDKVLAAFGGMAAGKLLSHFLDKAITSQPVQGLLGVSLSENLNKYLKPLLVTGTGLVTFQMSKNQYLKYAGIGCAAVGVSDVINVVTGKNYLAGITNAKGFGNPEVKLIDLETGQAIPPAPSLELPELKGYGMGAEEPVDEYIEPISQEDYVFVDEFAA
jgi:hypothetical protein